MAHHIHHTEGFIISRSNIGEANALYTIFTRELGMVTATAQGVRLLKSKLRYTLQPYSYARIDLVRGREIWRITSAQELPLFQDIKYNPLVLHLFVRMLTLLKRLYNAEEAHPELFNTFKDFFIFIEENNPAKEEIAQIESILALRILHNLGYIGETDVVKEYIESPLSLSLILTAKEKQRTLIQEINKSLRESQL